MIFERYARVDRFLTAVLIFALACQVRATTENSIFSYEQVADLIVAEPDDSMVVASKDSAGLVLADSVVMTSTDSVIVSSVDSSYVSQLDDLIAHFEAQEKIQKAIDDYNNAAMKKEMRFGFDNVIPFIRGFVSIGLNNNFITSHPAVFQKNNASMRDYAVSGSPLLAAWIMKVAGVDSRSSYRRMATANGFALALAAGLTEGTKHIVNERRPDLSDNHSFPSGHTALAYVGATVLAREYGHVSPWITVGGFTAATATTLLRIKHNSHWPTDVYMGAGIGIVSANFGYWLADRIFGEEGINKPELRRADLYRALKMASMPSSFSLAASTDFGKKRIEANSLTFSDDIDKLKSNDYHLHITNFTSIGVEGSWFLNPLLAVEVIAQSSVGQGKIYYSEDMGDKTFTGNALQMYRANVAVKGSMPIAGSTNRFALRASAGVRSLSKADFYLTDVDVYNPQQNYCITLPRNTKFELGCGFSYDVLDGTTHVIGFNFDYYHAFTKVIPNRFVVGTIWKILF